MGGEDEPRMSPIYADSKRQNGHGSLGLNASHHAAVNEQVLPGNVGGVVGNEERDSFGEFFEAADTFHRDSRKGFFLHRVRVDEAGQNGVHADVVRSSGFGMDARPR